MLTLAWLFIPFISNRLLPLCFRDDSNWRLFSSFMNLLFWGLGGIDSLRIFLYSVLDIVQLIVLVPNIYYLFFTLIHWWQDKCCFYIWKHISNLNVVDTVKRMEKMILTDFREKKTNRFHTTLAKMLNFRIFLIIW